MWEDKKVFNLTVSITEVKKERKQKNNKKSILESLFLRWAKNIIFLI